MSYTRVVPRDFFNESKLLKCLGQLTLNTFENVPYYGVEIEHDNSENLGFSIGLNGESEALFATNVEITIRGEVVPFWTRYNSKAPYPMYCEFRETEVPVFNEDGTFSREFLDLLQIKRLSFYGVGNDDYMYG